MSLTTYLNIVQTPRLRGNFFVKRVLTVVREMELKESNASSAAATLSKQSVTKMWRTACYPCSFARGKQEIAFNLRQVTPGRKTWERP